jgi:hypothetical protein
MDNKKLVRDILLSIPIGLLYIFFIYKIMELLTSESVYEEKIKKMISLSFIIVIVGLILAFKIFSSGKLKNRIIKYSLIFGNSIILFNSIIYHWPQLSTDTKALMIGILLVISFLLSYRL